MQQEEKKLSLDEIHAELLEQLRDITAVCKKHNISYNMMCGSLLGAVRHKGFIPWDDDVDLLMTREEFQKFREIYPKECDKRFEPDVSGHMDAARDEPRPGEGGGVHGLFHS